jgi:hypothetical protein
VAEAPKPVVAETVQKLQYSCKKCRKVLFTEDNLEEHMSKVKAYNTKTHSIRVSLTNACVNDVVVIVRR